MIQPYHPKLLIVIMRVNLTVPECTFRVLGISAALAQAVSIAELKYLTATALLPEKKALNSTAMLGREKPSNVRTIELMISCVIVRLSAISKDSLVRMMLLSVHRSTYFAAIALFIVLPATHASRQEQNANPK